jgi:ectoine hydroxylase-related dioxygenase (phytanoyl-CoA dioxygenase family)
MTDSWATALNGHTPLSQDVVSRYREQGYARLRNVFPPTGIEQIGREITQAVLADRPALPPMAERSTYDQAFIQITNLWRRDDTARQFVMGQRLARIAAELMGVTGVRLYHDQALYKEPGGGHTPWHVDQFYWPLASDHSCTAWVPLQDTPLEMGPLAFAAGSHRLAIGRDIGISDESDERLRSALDEGGVTVDESAYALGDVSFHSGWTAHRAGANVTDAPRAVMTVIYMDRDMRLAEPQNPNQIADREAFCPGIEVGQVIDSPMNPLLYESAR